MTFFDKNQMLLERYCRRRRSHPDDRFHAIQTIRQLQTAYPTFSAENRGDTLIPFHVCTLRSQYVTFEDGLYHWNYCWPSDPGVDHPEFIQSKINFPNSIPSGVKFDRLGPPDGSYLCPVSKTRVYSISERALPYFLYEDNIQRSSAYHCYNVKREITVDSLKDEIDKRKPLEKDSQKKALLVYSEKRLRSGKIIEGLIAPVKAFNGQGKGYGYQYKLPCPITLLLYLGFIEEEQ